MTWQTLFKGGIEMTDKKAQMVYCQYDIDAVLAEVEEANKFSTEVERRAYETAYLRFHVWLTQKSKGRVK